MDEPAGTPRRWRRRATLAVVTVAALAWLAAGVAAAAGLWPAAAAPAVPGAGDRPGAAAEAPAGAAGVAELVVAAWLSGDEAARTGLGRLVAGDLPTAPAAGTRYAARAAAVASAPAGPDRWQVTVAVDVLQRADDGYVPDGLAWFTVTVEAATPLPVVVDGPSERPAPPAPTPREGDAP